jgi:hypothetical protein
MGSSNDRLDYWLIGPLRRFVASTLVVWPMMELYMFINHHQSAPATTVLMPSWVPFCPAFIPAYMGLLLITWLLPVFICDTGRFRACLLANLCAWLLIMPWWLITPTMMLWPPLPEGLWANAFRWMWALDPPCNIMPSAHGTGPMVVAWFAGRDHPTWRWPLAGMLLVALPSIALVWQHRPIDILLGAVAGVIGIAVGEALICREQARLKGSDEIAPG